VIEGKQRRKKYRPFADTEVRLSASQIKHNFESYVDTQRVKVRTLSYENEFCDLKPKLT
jgi:hypothetical protein